MGPMALTGIQIKMLRKLLQSGIEGRIVAAIEKIHPSDLTVLFSELSANETQTLVNSLFSLSKAGRTLLELPEFMIPDILDVIEDNKLATMLARLESDDALFLMEKVPEERWKNILEILPRDKRIRLDKLLLYPKDSAGSVMTSSFITVKADMNVEEAIGSLREQSETGGGFYVYVVDEANRLVGVQSIRSLVLAKPNSKIADIMNSEVHSVLATVHKQEVSEVVMQYNLLAIPVVNDNRELVGVITVDDVVEIVEEEATEDIYNLVGLSESDRALTPLIDKVKKRLPWMLFNLITAAMAATVVAFFQASIQEFVVLAVFMPMVTGLGGNTATQSLTVISRSIALGEMNFIKNYKAILKETGNGLIIGLILGIVLGAVGYFWKGNIYLGGVLFLATTLNMLTGGLVGAAIPITFNALKLDPAVGTSVLVTMFTDILGFIFFLGLGTLMLQYLV